MKHEYVYIFHFNVPTCSLNTYLTNITFEILRFYYNLIPICGYQNIWNRGYTDFFLPTEINKELNRTSRSKTEIKYKSIEIKDLLVKCKTR